MKLLTKTSLNFLSIALFIFLIGTIAFYYILRQQVDQNINFELKKTKSNIENQLELVHSTGKKSESQDEKIIFSPIDNATDQFMRYNDTLILNKTTNKFIPFRELGFVEEIGGQKYFIQIFKSLEETDNLIVRIFLSMTGLVIIIILSLLFLNRHTSLKAWRVFYNTVDKINQYDINAHEQFTLEQSEVKEFDDLNRVLLTMTNRIKKDYFNLKEYTENASHEIQTPLAIINSKMELLLQSEDMQEKQYKAVADAYEASNRLSRLNKTLILLAKIENRQFPESIDIHPGDMIDNQLENLEDLILSKNIIISRNYEANVNLKMNTYLAEILFINLVKNAIRHNLEGGKLIIDLSNKSLKIANSGPAHNVDIDTLFKRFHKSSTSPESLGLGLAIVQKICEVYGFASKYIYKDDLHCFTIHFENSQSKSDSLST